MFWCQRETEKRLRVSGAERLAIPGRFTNSGPFHTRRDRKKQCSAPNSGHPFWFPYAQQQSRHSLPTQREALSYPKHQAPSILSLRSSSLTPSIVFMLDGNALSSILSYRLLCIHAIVDFTPKPINHWQIEFIEVSCDWM